VPRSSVPASVLVFPFQTSSTVKYVPLTETPALSNRIMMRCVPIVPSYDRARDAGAVAMAPAGPSSADVGSGVATASAESPAATSPARGRPMSKP
jgi:hypothetical protein